MTVLSEISFFGTWRERTMTLVKSVPPLLSNFHSSFAMKPTDELLQDHPWHKTEVGNPVSHLSSAYKAHLQPNWVNR